MAAIDKIEVLIIGGSYAGLAAGLTLGRSLRRVAIIDGGEPCNRQTPHSHNFLTNDGKTPADIAKRARAEVLQYPTVSLHIGLVTEVQQRDAGFAVWTQAGDRFFAQKLLFATGIRDEMPDIPGLAECWGISVLHCPYCHGYEVRNEPIGILANGDTAFELCRLINHWSPNLTLFTNGPSSLMPEQQAKMKQHGIAIVEHKVTALRHNNGKIEQVVLESAAPVKLTAMFTRFPFHQSTQLPEQLGCTFTEQGFIQVDELQRTSVSGVFAAGDNTTPMRSVAVAVAAGMKAGAAINRELIEAAF
ncbi:NAD(P)/FAD-dependent oxidoreductase [Pseudocnuella soli]|uniref:NAD(P)/FAD-dependent oxidoreductase n=1 Tax=Pseudocnuella soli TaxID=2502779 RepID=UPI001051DD6D|nr:NAD(P)/FAD-dependent oxidoreductase [Pseudocnuella soli]